MTRVFSFDDLRLIPELSSYTEQQLIAVEQDDVVNKWLRRLGFHMGKPIRYIPAKHRTLKGKVVVGYRAVGEVSANPAFLHSKLCNSTEYLVAVSKRDQELMEMLTALSDGMGGLTAEGEYMAWDKNDNEPDEAVVAAAIALLEVELLAIRGSPWREDGDLWYPGELSAMLEKENE